MEIVSNYHKWQTRALFVLAASLLPFFAPSASAISEFYQISNGSVTAQSSEPGLVIDTMVKATVPGTSFNLDDGQSFTLSFFDIWTDETKVNGDDQIPYAISATLNFSDPFTGATVNGVTVGGSFFKGLSQWGEVTWNGPVTVSLSGDRVFQISLSDEHFNFGFGGIEEGMMCGATVEATITQISSEGPGGEVGGKPTPESGSTAALLGTGLSGLILFARKRRLWS
jgi:hypothetical protein